MIITLQTDGRCIANVAHDFNAGTCLADAEALTSQNLLIALSMQLCETYAELKLLAIDIQCTIGSLLALNGIWWQALGIDAQEITNAGLL